MAMIRVEPVEVDYECELAVVIGRRASRSTLKGHAAVATRRGQWTVAGGLRIAEPAADLAVAAALVSSLTGQPVPAGEEGDQELFEHFVLAHDHLGQLAGDPFLFLDDQERREGVRPGRAGDVYPGGDPDFEPGSCGREGVPEVREGVVP